MPACALLFSRLREIWKMRNKTHLILFEMFVVFLYICTERKSKKESKQDLKVVTKFLQHKMARRDDKYTFKNTHTHNFSKLCLFSVF